MNESVRFGIIGTGSIASDQHAPAGVEASNARLHSVLSRSMQSAQKFASEFSGSGDLRSFTDLDEFLSDPALDAVIVASPDALHYVHAKACLEAGKHTLVEKPFTLTLAEGRTLIETVERSQRTLGVGFHMRWHPAIQTVLDLIKSDAIGPVRHISMRWTFQRHTVEDWRADSAMSRWWSLSGVGAHCIDLMWLFSTELGLTRDSFTASTVRNVLGSQNEETTAITATFKQGVSVQILSSVLFSSESLLAVYGESGTIECPGVLGRANAGKILLNGEPVDYAFKNPYVRQLEAFSSAVLSGVPYSVPGEAGLRVLVDLDDIH